MPPLLVARKGLVFVAWPGGVLRVDASARFRHVALPRTATGLAASAPFTRVRVAATTDEGGVVMWEEGDEQPFGEGLASPLAAFTRGGLLIALARDEGRVYRTDGAAVKHHATFKAVGRPLLAVLPTPKINEFAAVADDGLVRVYQVPG